MISDKEERFSQLVEQVRGCTRCSRMHGSARVIGAGCGQLDARVVFIGEAPGRLGADSSELPFHGDKSGHNFESLMEQVGISRYQAFVTNAVLCNPKDANGNNAAPSPAEILNCAPFLAEQLQIVDAPVVVTLGSVALRATDHLHKHGLSLREHVRTSHSWAGRLLIPAYHPGQRAMIHRSFSNQLADYQFIAETLRRLGPSKKRAARKPSRTSEKVGAAAQVLLNEGGETGYFELHKLLFLAEVRHLESHAARLTEGYYVRQKDGPYCVELHASRLPDLVPNCRVRTVAGRLMVSSARDLLEDKRASEHVLNEAERRTLLEVLAKYRGVSASKLKTATYLTAPMRALLRKEKIFRMNTFNSAILPPP